MLLIPSIGSWLYLHHIHLLPVHIIEATVQALVAVKTAKKAHLHTLTIEGDTLREAKIEESFCIASTNTQSLPLLPSSVYSVFQRFMYNGVIPIDIDLKLESSLITCGFKNVSFLKNILSALYPYMDVCINWNQLYFIINRTMDHLHTLSLSDYTASTAGTGYNTNMYSKIAQQVLAFKLEQTAAGIHPYMSSNKFSTNLPNISEEEEGTDDDQNNTLSLSETEEIICLVLSIWELLIPQIPFTSIVYKTMMECLVKTFPDILSVLEKTDSICEELSKQHTWSRDLVESLQESRATSVMYNDNTDSECEYNI